MQSAIIDFIRNEIVQDPSFDVAGDEDLFGSGILDSIGVVRLIDYLQARYQFKIPPQDLVPSHFRTVDAMAAYLQVRIAERSGC